MGFEGGMAAIAAVYQDTTNTLQVGLTTANTLTLTNSTTTDALTINQTGAADAIFINQDANSPAINIDTEATSTDTINIDSVNTSGVVFDLNLAPGSASTATMLDVRNNSNCTGALGDFRNAGTGDCWYVSQIGVLASGKHALYLYSNAEQDTEELVLILNDNANASLGNIHSYNDGTGTNIFIDQNGNGVGLLVDNDGNSYAIDIDQDTNSASDTYAVRIVSDNAGAGTGCGIDASGFSQDEPIFKLPEDDGGGTPSSGALSHQVAVDIGGTTYYLYAYTHVT